MRDTKDMTSEELEGELEQLNPEYAIGKRYAREREIWDEKLKRAKEQHDK